MQKTTIKLAHLTLGSRYDSNRILQRISKQYLTSVSPRTSRNDLMDFTPQAPMQIIHCNADDNVPYENATMAYKPLLKLVQIEEITLIDGGNFNHNECATFSVISAKLWFDTMLNGFESIGKNETVKAPEKKLMYVMNLLGKIVNPKTILGDVILLYVYDDGSVEKKINMTSNRY